MPDADSQAAAIERARVPTPPSEWRAWALAACVAAIGLAVLVAVISGAVGRRVGGQADRPPPLPSATATPQPAAPSGATAGSAASAPAASGGAIVARPTAAQQRAAARRLAARRAGTARAAPGGPQVHIERRWMEGFYPIYSTAQATFAVNWLLLASIHMQESAFSTAPGTYEGLNFAGCCGGPMQFNVTNGGAPGTLSTWGLVSDSYMYGRRPSSYDHMTARHPSIYDDFDAVMAAARLLSADGARYALDGSAWAAAYDYYGHDTTGVLYADRVLARAIGWSQRGFCINCGVRQRLVDAVHAAYGAPVQAALEAPPRARPPAPARARPRAR